MIYTVEYRPCRPSCPNHKGQDTVSRYLDFWYCTITDCTFERVI